MTFDDYQRNAMRTAHDDATLLYMATKLHIEAGELAQPVVKWQFHGASLRTDALIDEAGDVLWYLAGVCAKLGVPLEEVAARNLHKLAARHGAQYNAMHYQEVRE